MTSVCAGGGASRPKSGTAELLVLAAGGAALLQGKRPAWQWMTYLTTALNLAPIVTPDFCGADPPGFVELEAGDIAAILAPIAPNKSEAIDKLRRNILTLAWYEFCECVAGAQPAEPAAPPPPDNVPVVVAPSGALACGAGGHDSAAPYQFSNGGSSAEIVAEFTSGVAEVEVTFTSTPNYNGGWDIPFDMTFKNDSFHNQTVGTPIRFTVPKSGTSVFRSRIPAGATILRAIYNEQTPFNQIDLISWKALNYCTAGLGGTQGCCPPDTTIANQVASLTELVTLLQRQLVPFAHIQGESNSGIEGRGTIGVQGLLGVKVELTSIPSSYGVELGSPDFHFDVGWISVMSPDGLIEERRLSAAATSWFPRLMSDATVLGYSLSPGVVATVTELRREA